MCSYHTPMCCIDAACGLSARADVHRVRPGAAADRYRHEARRRAAARPAGVRVAYAARVRRNRPPDRLPHQRGTHASAVASPRVASSYLSVTSLCPLQLRHAVNVRAATCLQSPVYDIPPRYTRIDYYIPEFLNLLPYPYLNSIALPEPESGNANAIEFTVDIEPHTSII